MALDRVCGRNRPLCAASAGEWLIVPLIAVASTNRVKIEAALTGFRRMFPNDHYEAVGVTALSGVSDQPMTDDETLRGAVERAKQARQVRPDADFWVGIE